MSNPSAAVSRFLGEILNEELVIGINYQLAESQRLVSQIEAPLDP